MYLMRPFIVLASSMGPGKRGSTGAEGVEGLRNLVYHDDFSLVLGIISTFPVLIFIYSWSRRKPGAPDVVRKLWANGAWLLILAALLNIIIVFIPVFLREVSGIHMFDWLQIGIAVFIIGYLYKSQRVRDTFADFPVETDK
jgi:hypothetical protein